MKRIFLPFSFAFFSVVIFSQTWSPLGQGLNKYVNTLYLDTTSNLLYAGGDFDSSGSLLLNHIGIWNGVQWNALGFGFNNRVNAIASCNGEIFAAGNFTHSDTVTVNHIAKWTGTNWTDVGGGFNDEALSLFNFNGGLYAGGRFTIAGGVPCKCVAKWDGAIWQSLDTNMVSDGFGLYVKSISTYQNDLVIGGEFLANDTANHVAILKSGVWQSVGDNPNGFVNSTQEVDNELIITGYFDHVGSLGTVCVAKWDGTSWSRLPNCPTSSAVECVAIVNDNLVFGGPSNAFLNGNISSSHCIANFNMTTQEWSGIANGMNNRVKTFASNRNTLYAGGIFDIASSVPIKNIAMIDASTLSTHDITQDIRASVFPNPFFDQTTLQFSSIKEKANLKLFNSTGQVSIYLDNIYGDHLTITRGNLPPGLYYFILATDNSVIASGKLIAQ